jgi:hypothetical protein
MKYLVFALAVLAPAVDSGPIYADMSKAVWNINKADGSMELCAPTAGGDHAICLPAPAVPKDCGQSL